MSEIFYSQVDKNLQLELTARAKAGKSDRGEKALDFMLGKVANIELEAFEPGTPAITEVTSTVGFGFAGGIPIINYTPATDKKILHTLGGKNVREGEYLPTGTQGFLSDREYEIKESSWAKTGNELKVDTTTTSHNNTSKRIPPYISSADINIGDHSMGLLNKATINIIIPNPDRDLSFFEAIWLRPGRKVKIIVAHPDSAVITKDSETGGYLSDDTFPSTETIKKIDPSITDSEISQAKKLNEYVFFGLITTFSLDYQVDASVSVTLHLTGTSQSYTDVSMFMNIDNKSSDDEQEISGTLTDSFGTVTAAANIAPAEEITVGSIPTPNSLFNDLEASVNLSIKRISKMEPPANTGTGEGIPVPQQPSNEQPEANQRNIGWTLWGNPVQFFKNKPDKSYFEKYVNIEWIINYFNNVIIKKNKESKQIICTDWEELCVSNMYEHICSANPMRLFISNREQSVNTYDTGFTWYKKVSMFKDDESHSYFNSNNLFAFPSHIFINLEVIKEILDILGTQEKESSPYKYNVTEFFNKLSNEIFRQLGGAIKMQFITHPQIDNVLLWYDANAVIVKNAEKPVIPYPVPMFANDNIGTIVRDFKFSTQLPTSVKNLAYVLNQDPENISESEIAPYMNFMFNSLDIDRQGNIEVINGNATEQLEKLKTIYSNKHFKYVKELKEAKKVFIHDFTNISKSLKLRQALVRYIQYPTESIKDTNKLTAPILPFDVEITMDGINGFRYGDILQFEALPERYRKNTVFSIIGINHTISTAGDWTTKLQCLMRPKIEDD